MNTKRFQILVGLMTIAVMLLAACAPAATPTAAPAAPAQSAATTAPAAGTTSRICDGVHVVFFPGGDAGTPFTNNVYNGAKQAEHDLGAKVDYVFSGWDPQKMISQFKEAVAIKPDGIAIMGHPGDDAFDTLIDDAETKGIIVTSQNTQLPNAQAKYAAKGFGYVGAINYNAGSALGAEAAKRAGLKQGDRAMVWGLLSQPGRGQRTQGAIDAVAKVVGKANVDYIEIDAATNADASAGTPTFTGYVAAHPDVKLIITDHGAVTATLQTYLTAAGKKPGDIYTAGFDMSPATLPAIQGGWTNLVLDQQPYLQGYLPILQICLTKKYGFAGLAIDTGAGMVDKSNVDFLAPFIKAEIR
jgi:simple sugar transport system substrate-binding protein